jgi:DNA polymerase-3 subunit epsilon
MNGCIHVVDFEGTLSAGVVEYGVVTLDSGFLHGVATAKCRPDAPVLESDAWVHGLSDDELEDCVSFRDARDLFFRLRQTGLMAAHHASVENHMLMRYWSVIPIASDPIGSLRQCGAWGPWLDTRQMASRWMRGRDASLMARIREAGLVEELDRMAVLYCPMDRRRPHCALFDALASALLLLWMTREFKLSLEGMLSSSQSIAAKAHQDSSQQEWI